MELEAEDGSIVGLPAEGAQRELGRGPGFAPRDRTVSHRQVRLTLQQGVNSSYEVLVEVIGPNPICVIHPTGGEKENKVLVLKKGETKCLEPGDQFSMSIQEPVFYKLRDCASKVMAMAKSCGLGIECLEPGDQFSMSIQELVFYELRDCASKSFTTAGQGEEEVLSQTGSQKSGEIVIDEEAGIAETVARWQQRKRDRLELERRRLQEEEGSSAKIQGKGHIHGEGEGEGIRQASSAQEPKLEVTELRGTIASDIHPVKRFGFLAEGLEFEQYGQRARDCSEWDWRIGTHRRDDDDDNDGEDEDEDDEPAGKRSKNNSGAKVNIKIGGVNKNANAEDDDDDDWEGDNEEEKGVLVGGKRSALPKPGTPDHSPHPPSDPDSGLLQSVRGKNGTQALKDEAVNQDDPREKDPSENKHDRVQDAKARGLTHKPAQKTSKQKSKAKEEEEEEDDDNDDGEDLDGFLVKDAEEEDAEVGDEEEDEWTDEGEDEDEDGSGPSHIPTTRSSKSKKATTDKPLCKYGSSCFRKNKDHLAQFQH